MLSEFGGLLVDVSLWLGNIISAQKFTSLLPLIMELFFFFAKDDGSYF